MTIISSKYTFVEKWIHPAIIFALILFFILNNIAIRSEDIGFIGILKSVELVVLLAAAIFVYYLYYRFVWDLMDRVEDHGEYLLVKYGSSSNSGKCR